ncbi:MAG: helix-turn-helix domain-containing protein [Reichenbachiella sp.]|uniref:helix-turn-helix domain-containing protein n=1 Tax=Reichenbachiella sp. TaxID=2184521 RepID=UPI00326700F9
MSVINFIGIGLAIFLAFLLVLKSEKRMFDYILLAWLLLNATMLFFYYLNFEGHTHRFVPLLIAMGLIPYLISPLLFIYVSSLVQGSRFSLVRQSLHFLPFVFILFSMWWYYWNPDDRHIIRVAKGFINVGGDLPFQVRYWSLIMAFSACLYPLLCLFKLFKHRSIIENEFSNLQEKTLDWMRYWIIIEFVAFWISFLIIIAGDFDMVERMTSFKVIAGMIIVNVFVVGFFGVKQSNIFVGSGSDTIDSSADEKYKSSNLNLIQEDALMERLTQEMKDNKHYLNPALNATDVAGILSITKHQLSQLINQKTNGNFYEFVNQYRLEEFKARVLSGEAERLSLLGLAFDCGFNSKSTFNHLFKKNEGTTPSAFRKNINERSPN